jgi:predicted O-methyltransferase YrrM
MAARKPFLAPVITRYVHAHTPAEDALQRRLRAETAKLPRGGMQISADLGALLAVLVGVVGARRALEIGTFTGMSALVIARALPPDGRLVTCDVSEESTRIARRYWTAAGVADKVDLRLGPAVDTLTGLERAGGAGSYDLAFIDANKTGYDAYYEASLRLLRPGGLIVLDNMLWSGWVADPAVKDADTRALRALNRKIRNDARVDACLLSVGDGVTLARKR